MNEIEKKELAEINGGFILIGLGTQAILFAKDTWDGFYDGVKEVGNAICNFCD